MAGAPSTLDLFDYKPQLIKLHGQPLPESFSKNLKTAHRRRRGRAHRDAAHLEAVR